MLQSLALRKHSNPRFSQFRIFVLTLLALSLVLLLSAGKVYSGQATLSWSPPTTNADGTLLTDLEGYKVYYATSSGNYSQNINAGNVTTYTVANLTDGLTYYFVATAYDKSGNESGYSNAVSKTIPPTQQYTLSLNKIGTGSGTVTSSPAGINCSSDCSEAYNAGTVVTLTASPDTSSTFAGWSGGCTGTGTCTVTMSAAKAVTATFTLKTYTITATAGTGGSISPSGSVSVNHGASQTFTVTANTGYSIADVKVDGTSVGAVSTYTFKNVTTNHTISASFTMNTYTLTVTKAGTGTGAVTSSPAGINCGSDCSEAYNAGTVVTLTASPDTSSTFAGWSGGCAGTGQCVITVNKDLTVSASFTANGNVEGNATIYEDAEDETIKGWNIYDNDPLGANIINVYDYDRMNRVIQLTGSGTSNGYRLRKDDMSAWNNSTQFVIEWSMKYSEDFNVYIDAETTAGPRYIYYTPDDYNNLGTGEYVHHGLGSGIIDGKWHTFVRDLQAELQEAQPGVTILKVNGFLIRGSGRVDDIKLITDFTYISDLQWIGTPVNGWGPIERDKSNGESAAGDGRTITLNGVSYTEGLGVHANSEIRYNLGGGYSSFISDIGVDDEAGNMGSVVFQVWADGMKIYDSGIMTGSSATKKVDVDVTGKNELKLIVTDAGDGIDYDHADWANAYLINVPVTYISDLQWIGTPVNGWGPSERDNSNGESAAGDGRTITLNGVSYTEGLGVHANSEIRYYLGGGYSTFISDIGVDDEAGNMGSVVFQVWADGIKIYDSGIMTGSSATKKVDVDVTGKNELKLIVTDAGDNISYDHADWAGACIW